MKWTKVLIAAAAALPAVQATDCISSERPNLATWTSYKPGDRQYNGLKANYNGGLNLFTVQTSGYCPLDPPSSCPKGTETAWAGVHPYSIVPGGQDMYVDATGLIRITVQHSHYIPPDAYGSGIGWHWNALPLPECQEPFACPRSAFYVCSPPSGYWTFQLEGEEKGGIRACPNPYDSEVTSIYAVTPGFNRTDCVELTGLGTHNYTGEPIWAFM